MGIRVYAIVYTGIDGRMTHDLGTHGVGVGMHTVRHTWEHLGMIRAPCMQSVLTNTFTGPMAQPLELKISKSILCIVEIYM